ncbi:hypothetical protein [Kitasatospora sp. NBC_00240]|uniref:hypothetical protein n=1 Tax=Kitasatospora sp. NBC_00240 TaxID=2903567 RepID=UPI002B1D53AC|nr:hypothetical protein [Kitasatospora sp. NBC_00240]
MTDHGSALVTLSRALRVRPVPAAAAGAGRRAAPPAAGAAGPAGPAGAPAFTRVPRAGVGWPFAYVVGCENPLPPAAGAAGGAGGGGGVP